MIVEVLFGAVYILSGAMSLWSLVQLQQFLARTPAIADGACLERFKALARIQMYLALVAIVLLTIGMIGGIGLIMRHGLRGFLLVIVTNMLVLGLGMYHKRVEARTRTLQAGSEVLANEYRHVSETWVKKPLPDF